MPVLRLVRRNKRNTRGNDPRVIATVDLRGYSKRRRLMCLRPAVRGVARKEGIGASCLGHARARMRRIGAIITAIFAENMLACAANGR
jgi:hypothetical protein